MSQNNEYIKVRYLITCMWKLASCCCFVKRSTYSEQCNNKQPLVIRWSK